VDINTEIWTSRLGLEARLTILLYKKEGNMYIFAKSKVVKLLRRVVKKGYFASNDDDDDFTTWH
jgi:hypothetical protein